MGNLAFALTMWAQHVTQWPMSEQARHGPSSGSEGLFTPTHPSPSRYQCPGLLPLCLNTSSDGNSSPPGLLTHLQTASAVRKFFALKKKCLHSFSFLSLAVRPTKPHPFPYSSPSDIGKEYKCKGPQRTTITCAWRTWQRATASYKAKHHTFIQNNITALCDRTGTNYIPK